MDKGHFLAGLMIGGVVGFGAGVYLLPILVAEEGASSTVVTRAQMQELRSGMFRKDIKGSDALHWGKGRLTLSQEEGMYYLTLDGKIAPGPDYRLYLTKEFVMDDVEFLKIKESSVQIAMVKTYENFRYDLPQNVIPSNYKGVVVWCEKFGKFITATELK